MRSVACRTGTNVGAAALALIPAAAPDIPYPPDASEKPPAPYRQRLPYRTNPKEHSPMTTILPAGYDETAEVPDCICHDSNLAAHRDCPYCYPSLDVTPVDDLESWQRDYDPASAASFDARLDAAFGGAR